MKLKREHTGDSFCPRLPPGPDVQPALVRTGCVGRRELRNVCPDFFSSVLPSQELRSALQTQAHSPIHCGNGFRQRLDPFTGLESVMLEGPHSQGSSGSVPTSFSQQAFTARLLEACHLLVVEDTAGNGKAKVPVSVVGEQPLSPKDRFRVWWVW